MTANINPLLLLDYYKTTHHEQYPKGITKVVSYLTPRLSKIPEEPWLILFGLQGFIKEYLIRSFNENFFTQDKTEILREYRRVLDCTLGKNIVNYDKVAQLHDLGYLPIEIKALPEGTKVPVGVPCLEISNTHGDFAWLTNTLETMLCCTLWHTMLSANAGFRLRAIVNKYYELSVDSDVLKSGAMGDFSMRGQESCESAVKSSAAFCLSFVNTATVPAVLYLERFYNCDIEREDVAFGAISTEHSVMSSNYAADGDEITFIKRLLTEVYPNNSFSMVSDSYDYWRLVEELLPACKAEILAHNGFIGIRGDSGDPVEIVTQTVFKLWRSFGGSMNSKGFKFLNPHIKVIYGDGIIPRRAEDIYKILTSEGFAANNVFLASGSHSMQGYEYGGVMIPYTRDTYGIAAKATYCEIKGKSVQIYKAPKTDTDNIKKSQRGMCAVYRGGDGQILYRDGFDAEGIKSFEGGNLLEEVFRDGEMLREQSLCGIRALLHEGKF